MLISRNLSGREHKLNDYEGFINNHHGPRAIIDLHRRAGVAKEGGWSTTSCWLPCRKNTCLRPSSEGSVEEERRGSSNIRQSGKYGQKFKLDLNLLSSL